MTSRLCVVSGHLVQQPCRASAPTAGFRSPTGRTYPPNTAASLTGNMEPITEEVTCQDLIPIFGALPADIDGQFIRTGPNPLLDRFGQAYHEFNGDGMLHSVDLKDGKGTYTNRWVRTQRFKMDLKNGEVSKAAKYFGNDGIMLGAANTALVHHAGALLALYELDRPYIISAPSLETFGQLTYGGALSHGMTAHPKVCPETGEMIFFGYSLMEPKVTYGVASPQGRRTCTLEVPTQGGRPVMMHDMAITKRYSILIEFPLYFDLQSAIKGESMPFSLDRSLPSKFGIMPRHPSSTMDIRWFTADTAMAFHCANAWEEGDTVHLIGCPTRHFSFEYGESAPSRLYKWIFNMTTGTTQEMELDSTWTEFPVVHPLALGSRSRYVFAACFSGGTPPFFCINGCIKYDTESASVLRHDFVDGRWGGECIFIPRTAAALEDDGYLVTYTYNPKDMTTELYILDALTMAPKPLAILRTPKRVPFGFHGIWLPRTQPKVEIAWHCAYDS